MTRLRQRPNHVEAADDIEYPIPWAIVSPPATLRLGNPNQLRRSNRYRRITGEKE